MAINNSTRHNPNISLVLISDPSAHAKDAICGIRKSLIMIRVIEVTSFASLLVGLIAEATR
jgi:hypothetical protein